MDRRANRLLALLSRQAALAQLEPYFRAVELKQGEVLAESQQPLRLVYFPYSGIISSSVPLKDGHLIQTGMVGRDGVVGAMQALDRKVSPNKLIVVVPGVAEVADVDVVGSIIQANPNVRELLASHEQFFLAEVQQSAACNAVHAIEQRTCRWLLRMNDLIGMKVPLTQELLAEMMGVRRTSVTMAAATLQKAGFIRYRRGHIHIVDIEGIKQKSCECYEVVKDHYDRLLNDGFK
jgi:CRP-like cAMP-binding protein